MRLLLGCLILVFAMAGAQAVAAGRQDPPTHQRAGVAQVGIRDFAFHPGTTTVGRGTRIVFANRDSTAHTATRSGGFDTGRIRPGRSASVTLQRSGTYAYHCSIHSFMRGKIVVR